MGVNAIQSVNIMQSAQEKFKTKMQVNAFNAQLEKNKVDNKTTQKDQFLRILVTQLKNQNPLEPVKDKEFIAQMAQLSSVEKLEQLNENLSKMGDVTTNTSYFNLIGKQVSYIDHTGQEVLGLVDSIHLKKGKGFISVNGQEINLSDITEIRQKKLQVNTLKNKSNS